MAEAQSPNSLTDEEKAQGWRLLFDGKTGNGWRGFRKDALPEGWQVRDGSLARVEKAGDIITEDQFDNLELALEWKISEGGNSGIFFRVTEEEDQVWRTGPEMQVLDNDRHRDGKNPLTMVGSNYAMHAPPADFSAPVGKWNQVRILVDGNHVEYWLNGKKTVEYELFSDDWEARVAKCKFAKMPNYGRAPKGHVALQDHGDMVWFRNIKIRPLS